MFLCLGSYVGPNCGHTWGLACAPDLDGQSHHDISFKQPCCVPPLIPLVWPFCIGHLFIVGGDFVHIGTGCIQKDLSVWTVIAPGFYPALQKWPNAGLDPPAGLMPVFQGHTGDLLIVLHWVQDMQITTICLYGACGALKGSFSQSLHCCSCDLEVSTWVVRHAPQLGHPW